MRVFVLAMCVATLTPAAVTSLQAQLVPDSGRVVRDSRGGGGRAFAIESRILKEKRRINVALPPSYALSSAQRRYPVTIVLDGEFSLPAVAAVSDELARNGQIPEAIIVAIENTNRLRDLTPPGISVSGSSKSEGGDRFLDFIEQELLPEIVRQFRGSAPFTFIGHSSGGILVTYAAATRPLYRNVIAIDTPTRLDANWLATRLIEHARVASSPLRYVSYEARFGWADETWKALTSAAPSSWRLHREPLPMENHESIPMLAMYLGLREVFRDYSMLAAPVSPTTQILPYYAKVSESLGAPVLPPKKLLANVIEDLMMEGRGAAARAAYAMEVEGYGEPADAPALVQRIAEVEQRPPPTETVEGLLATPFPTPREAAKYLGDWMGDVYMNTDELGNKPQSRLRVFVANGKVHGETIMDPEPGVHMVQEWTYMRITPTGLTYGYMNGMRPRGMLLHEGTLKNDALTGVMRFGGIDFRPDGFTPGEIKFRYQKVKSP